MTGGDRMNAAEAGEAVVIGRYVPGAAAPGATAPLPVFA